MKQTYNFLMAIYSRDSNDSTQSAALQVNNPDITLSVDEPQGQNIIKPISHSVLMRRYLDSPDQAQICTANKHL